jgi:uncharacterized cupredoxin-like copper-binding protein
VKRRDTSHTKRPFPTLLIGKLGIVALALLIVVWLGFSTTSATHSTAAIHNTPTPTEADTINFAQIDETPVAGAKEVKVTLAEFSVKSTVTVFHTGVPYYFVVTNSGQQVHEFMIMPTKPDGSPEPPDVQYNDKLIEIEQVAPGSTLYINFVFLPSKAGRYEIACLMRGHYQAGMKLPIVVTH